MSQRRQGDASIYLAVSVRGVTSPLVDVGWLIEAVAQHGQVLTEHLAAQGGADLPDADIHARQMAWLRDSDAVVAEASLPSLGVGYEIAMARELRKPLLVLHRDDSEYELSAMVAGDPEVTTVAYGSAAQAQEAISRFLDPRSEEREREAT